MLKEEFWNVLKGRIMKRQKHRTQGEVEAKECSHPQQGLWRRKHCTRHCEVLSNCVFREFPVQVAALPKSVYQSLRRFEHAGQSAAQQDVSVFR